MSNFIVHCLSSCLSFIYLSKPTLSFLCLSVCPSLSALPPSSPSHSLLASRLLSSLPHCFCPSLLTSSQEPRGGKPTSPCRGEMRRVTPSRGRRGKGETSEVADGGHPAHTGMLTTGKTAAASSTTGGARLHPRLRLLCLCVWVNLPCTLPPPLRGIPPPTDDGIGPGGWGDAGSSPHLPTHRRRDRSGGVGVCGTKG